MSPLVAFVFGVMVGNLFGMFLMAMLVTAARADRA
jgi:F0F1-type ATP synthase assembly protein I